MKEKRITMRDILDMSTNEIKTLNIIFQAQAWRMLGINWEKEIYWYRDVKTNDVVFKYE